MSPAPSLSLLLALYERNQAALDGARDNAIERVIASGDIVKQQELLLLLDQMTREYRDL